MKHLISVITPCARAYNLPVIAHTIPAEWEWIVVFDADAIPAVDADTQRRISRLACVRAGVSGNPQRNLALGMATADYVYFLDDDNVVHPALTSVATTALTGRAVVINQVWPDGSLRLRAKAPISPGAIDAAQILVPRGIAQSLRWQESQYAADGLYFAGLWERWGADAFAFVDRDASYYNFLRQHTPAELRQLRRLSNENARLRGAVARLTDG